jgi:hypothetical protein
MSLFEIMAATRVGGWDAAQQLTELVRAGKAIVQIVDGATCYKAVS